MAKPRTTTTRPRPSRNRTLVDPPQGMLGPVPGQAQNEQVDPSESAIGTTDAAATQGGAPTDLGRLQALAQALLRTRDEAISGRMSSGIEDIWREDQEHFEGVDELTKSLAAQVNQQKPPGQLPANVADHEATEFVNITRPYCNAASAKVGDTLLPNDDKGWAIETTPMPDVEERARKLPVEVLAGMAQANVPEQTAVEVAQTEAATAKAAIKAAKDKAQKAEDWIDDCLTEGQYTREVRKVIATSAKIGTGVLKGPVPMKKREQMFRNNTLAIVEMTKPVSKWVDPWNCFPDPSCGTSIHNGRYHWERDYLTPKQLEGFKGVDGYISAQIDLCLQEGPEKKKPDARETAEGRRVEDKGVFEVWYFYGYATREDLEAAGCDCSDLPAEAPVFVPAVFTLVNDRVIKADLNPLDTGEFPYDYFPWSPRQNMPWGDGIARQIRTAQRILTAATRVMLTNAGRAAGPIILMRRKVIGADGNNNILPWKVFFAPEADTSKDVAELMKVYELPDRQQSLQNIINYALKIAEDTTGLPLLLQGQNGSAPDTLGGLLLVDRNASAGLRAVARQYDDFITEPHIRRYYAFLLQYGPDEAKGDFVIRARGSTVLVEREINREEAVAMLKLSTDPRFGIDPKKAMAEKLRADKRNPDDFQYDPDEMARMEAAAQQQPPNPAVQVAQINAKSRETIAQAEMQHETEEKAKDRQVDLIVQQMLEHVEAMKVDGAQEISFQQLKAELAGIAMKLKTQQNLSAVDAAVAVHKHGSPPARPPQALTPPTEPAGRAQPGHAFEQ